MTVAPIAMLTVRAVSEVGGRGGSLVVSAAIGVLGKVASAIRVGVRVTMRVLIGRTAVLVRATVGVGVRVPVFVAVGCLRIDVAVDWSARFVGLATTIGFLGVAVAARRTGWRVGDAFLTTVFVGEGLAGCLAFVAVGCGLAGTRVAVAARTVVVGLSGERIAVGGLAVGGLSVLVG